MTWISVKEREPESSDKYIVALWGVHDGKEWQKTDYIDYNSWVDEYLTKWANSEWGIYYDNPDDGIVTHWMPWPKPPPLDKDKGVYTP